MKSFKRYLVCFLGLATAGILGLSSCNSGNDSSSPADSLSSVESSESPEITESSATSTATSGTEDSSSSEHVHSYDDGVVTKEPTCTEAGEKTYTCVDNDHSYTEVVDAIGHSTGDTWSHDTTNHWHECATCHEHVGTAAHSYDAGVVTKAATCTEAGVMTYTCETCAYSYTSEIEKINHATSDTWSHDATNHWHGCATCDEHFDSAAHSYDAGVVTQAATCTEVGVMTYTCETCGYSYTTEIEKISHTFKAEFAHDAEGHWHVCEVCNEASVKEEHVWVHDAENSYDSTLATDGLDIYTCECGEERRDILPATGIAYVITPEIETGFPAFNVDHRSSYTFVYDEATGNYASNNTGVNSSTSYLDISIIHDGYITFDYTVSSEARWDGLYVLYDGEYLLQSDGKIFLSGSQSGSLTIAVQAEKNVLFMYGKDGGTHAGTDNAIISNLKFYCTTEYQKSTLSFNTNGGEAIDAIEVYQTAAITLPTPVKENHFFDYWCSDEACEVEFDYEAGITANTTIYAKFTAGVTVSYANTGDSSIESVVVRPNTAFTLPDDPTYANHYFAGWFADEACQVAFDATNGVDGNTTVYAGWRDPITLSFETYEGTSIEQMSMDINVPVAMPDDPTKDGYRFDGWYTTSTYETEFDGGSGITASTTIHAKWVKTWNVTLNPNNGTDSYVVTLDENTEYSAPVMAREGFLFDGWYLDESFTEAYTNESVITSDIAIYAKWTQGKYENNAANYIDAAGGQYITSFDIPSEYAMTIGYRNEDQAIVTTCEGVGNAESSIAFTINANLVITMNFYVSTERSYDIFRIYINDVEEMRISGDEGGQLRFIAYAGDVIKFSYKKDGSGNNNEDKVYLWNFDFALGQNITVTYNYNDGVTEPTVQTVVAGDSVGTLPVPEDRDGYVFKGWYTDNTYTQSFSPIAVLNESTTAIAKWNKLYTVTVNANNDTEASAVITEEGQSPEIANPTKQGFIFVGWYTSADFAEGTEYALSPISADVIIYAKWDVAPAYVGTYGGVEVYNATGLGSATANKTFIVGEDLSVTVQSSRRGTIIANSYDPETGLIKYLDSSGTERSFYFFTIDGTSYALVNYGATQASGVLQVGDYYIFILGRTVTGVTGRAVWGNGNYRAVSLTTSEGEVAVYVDGYAKRIYPNATFETLSGTALTVGDIYTSATYTATLAVKDSQGNVIQKFASVNNVLGPLDGYEGTYAGSIDALTLDGAGSITSGEVTSTYTIADGKILFIKDGKTVAISVDTTAFTYTVVADIFEGTYTGDAGQLVLDGFGNATLAEATGTYTFVSTQQVVVTISGVSTNYILSEGAYVLNNVFAGYTFSGSYYDEWDETNNTIRVLFHNGSPDSFTATMTIGNPYVFEYSVSYSDGVLTFEVTSAANTSFIGKTFTGTVSGDTITLNGDFGSNTFTFEGASITCTGFSL